MSGCLSGESRLAGKALEELSRLTNHEAVVKQAVIVEVLQSSDLAAQDNTSNHSSTGATQATAKGDGVLDVNMGLDGEISLVVASQDVEGDAGKQVGLGVEADVAGALSLSLVRDPAVERVLRLGLGAVDGDVQLEVHREGEADDIEARANVGAGAGGLDDKRFHDWSCPVC